MDRQLYSAGTIGHLLALAVWSGVGAAGWAQPAARPTGPVDTCVTPACHGQILSGRVPHEPAVQQKCTACHRLVVPEDHRFELAAPPEQLCRSCHVQSQRTFIHAPVAKGECTGCHDPHGSDYRFHLVADPGSDLCGRCHRLETLGEGRFVHGPVAAGACIVCHEAHSSWRPTLLAEEPEVLCLRCHQDVMDHLELARHPHPPVEEGRCLTCHDPHVSDASGQLREAVPDLCYTCHVDLRARIEAAPRRHGAIDTEASCTACHSGHGGTLPALLTRPTMSLCLTCHDEALTTPEGRRLTNMAVWLRNNPNQHGPLRRADCSSCHDPHASEHFQLLVEAYPELFYAPFDPENYRLCFRCHLEQMVTRENGWWATGFRDGEKNLHYLHVNKPDRGRTCRACHEVHASRRPFHVRESVPYGRGGWELEIGFEPLPDGGRCAPGCHQPRSYHRGGPAGLPSEPVKGPESKP